MLTTISHYDLTKHNTFGITARCKLFVEYHDEREALEAAAILRQSQKPFLIVGAGSNLLLTADFPGIVVHAAMKGMELHDVDDNHALITCGAGETWDDVVKYSLEHQCYGAENLSLIPGEVGASAVQNIGAYGAEVGNFIQCVSMIRISSGEQLTVAGEDCKYGYRDSRFKHEWKNHFLITRVTYQFSRHPQVLTQYGNLADVMKRRGITSPTPEQMREVVIDVRRSKLPDPEVMGNAGSFFMNPVVTREVFQRLAAQYSDMPYYAVDDDHFKIPAGWMIDQCGWKGKALGRAAVHDKQALVLVNLGGATGQDIVRLKDAIASDVRKRFGVTIIPEVNII